MDGNTDRDVTDCSQLMTHFVCCFSRSHNEHVKIFKLLITPLENINWSLIIVLLVGCLLIVCVLTRVSLDYLTADFLKCYKHVSCFCF